MKFARWLVLLTLAGSTAWGQSSATAGRTTPPAAAERSNLRAWFPGGVGIQIDTESTGPSSPVDHGSLIVNDHGTYRVIVDRNENALYAYVLEAFSAPNGTFTIRIRPIPEDFVANARAHIPTVSGVREFTGLKRGQAVRLDVLSNGATGETIYDVLRPTTEPPSPPTGERAAYVVPAREELCFRDITLKVNGTALTPPSGWLTGAAARLYIPGLGAYYIAAYEPKLQQTFHYAVKVEQKKLEFSIDGDRIEIQSQGNALTLEPRRIVWVYHDPNFKTSLNPVAPDVVVADAVEYLLTRR